MAEHIARVAVIGCVVSQVVDQCLHGVSCRGVVVAAFICGRVICGRVICGRVICGGVFVTTYCGYALWPYINRQEKARLSGF